MNNCPKCDSDNVSQGNERAIDIGTYSSIVIAYVSLSMCRNCGHAFEVRREAPLAVRPSSADGAK